MLAVQFGGERFHPGHINLLEPVTLLVFVAMFAVVVLPLFEAFAAYARLRARARRGRRRRAHAAATAEERARVLMGELCPHGWQAQVTLVGTTDGPWLTRPDGARSQVALDWTALEPDGARAAVVRRVWAPTLVEALDAMVADRRTDETLEQIEHSAFANGEAWPDL